ncbi:family 16 glycoside hydrolase [Chryseolinea sp. H1M3-3]|uniref:family 16 glycoside hydrolase n=1 Tax=Chryseolinea sp. H1M3-3 TaxID=3034144 RepID=UPI0023EB1323|nr:family 16 glycoside hydrolase [Chryseolinea sp. H1M3-3]
MMTTKSNFLFILLSIFSLISCNQVKEKKSNEWVTLFNGKDLSNWEANENPGSFKVVDGMIVANGERSHLFYVGDKKEPANFKNFELNLDVMTHHLANSGVYFHTAHQKEGWLDQGYEVQVNSSHRGGDGYKEVKKGGSLYGIRNLYKAYTKDSVWYNFNIRVEGKHVQIKINDQLVVDYTEPTHPARAQTKKVLSSGTFALQGHDPGSTVYFKNIKVKDLGDTPAPSTAILDDDVAPRILDYQANHLAFIDYHIHTGESFNIDSAMQAFYRTGINLGLVVDIDKLEKGKEDATLSAHVNKYGKLPLFLGIFKNNLQPLGGVQKKTIEQFDYFIGDITRFKNAKGQEVDVLKNENIGDKQAFMEDYVKAITTGLDKGEINIWATATLLPESLSSEYDQLWTPERMASVIDAAKRNNVAIEVYNPKRIPSITFLKLAKDKGCLFTTGGLFKENKISEPDYFYDVIDQCKLEYKDIYIPGNPN